MFIFKIKFLSQYFEIEEDRAVVLFCKIMKKIIPCITKCYNILYLLLFYVTKELESDSISYTYSCL